mmetsp:Transcript_26232/g.79004  ORF Transcript_26232/g.79004 Transcript_26232/m.79004 type:complete len:85 (+) Transcript_26232:219-473(+)
MGSGSVQFDCLGTELVLEISPRIHPRPSDHVVPVQVSPELRRVALVMGHFKWLQLTLSFQTAYHNPPFTVLYISAEITGKSVGN